MRLSNSLCFLIVSLVLIGVCDGRKTFSSRRKSGGNNQRSSPRQKPATPQQSTPHRTDSSLNNHFLNHERAGSSHAQPQPQSNVHYRGSPFDAKPSAPEAPKSVPHNGPVGFENAGKQNLGFDKVNSEVQQKHSGISAPAYPAGNPPYPVAGKPAIAPNGPPPAYPGYNTPNTANHPGGFEPPPAYPGRPVNAPPAYNPNYNQRNPTQGGYPNQQGYQQSSYPQHQGNIHQGGYPTQQGSYPGHSYPSQQNFGYNSGGGYGGNYPNQGYNQGFGGGYSGGFGQSPNYGGYAYGGSPFGHSNYGGSPFGGGSGFGGNGFGGSGYGSPSYNPNSFGFSNNPGFFGSQSPYPGYTGKYSNFGYHKKSRFGGLPIPIPIPIPIPLGGSGGFGGFGGGHSYNHRVLNSFVKNQNATTNDNATTNVFILNNSTVTPCTTDQFIYDSLNITLMSCTAGNCTAIKMFVTTYMSNESNAYSAGLTMCLEPNATYSSFAENVNPVVSDMHRYWMRVCKELVPLNSNGTESDVTNTTVKITETVLNETVVIESNATSTETPISTSNQPTESPAVSTTNQPSIVESTTSESISEKANASLSVLDSAEQNSTSINATNSFCETFNCHWIEMCLPAVELADRCTTPNCSFTKTSYQPCVRIKMCKSPSTPISTFATLNTTISRTDQSNNITSVNDVANLTLISYIPQVLPANCSQDASDPSCQTYMPLNPPEVCAPGVNPEATEGAANNGTGCVPLGVIPFETFNSSTTEAPSTTPVR